MNKIVAAGTESGHGSTRAAEGFPRHAWTLAEFEQLSVQGYFGGIEGPRKRVELIDGEIVPMASKGARHELVKGRLANHLARRLPAGLEFYVELGWRPGGDIYCEPDLLICPACPEPSTVPPADVVLVVEVSDSSLSYDRTVKARIYAGLGVREYWSIDANSLKTMVHLAPSPGGYLTAREIGANGLITPTLAPELAMAIHSLKIAAI